MFISTLLSALFQLIVLTLIPFVYYVVTERRIRGFWAYIGIKPVSKHMLSTSALVGLLLALATLWVLSNPGLHELMTDPASQTGRLRAIREESGIGILLYMAVIQAVIQTALAEEILFRGFIAKRLIAWRGFLWGNLIQAAIFAAVHWALFLLAATALTLTQWLIIFAIPLVLAWVIGYMNERMADGSIVPGWAIHAMSNLVSFIVIPLVW